MKTATNRSTKNTLAGSWKSLTFLALLLAWLGSCEQNSNNEGAEVHTLPASSSELEPSAPEASESPQLALGNWQNYPETLEEQEWIKEPLDGQRWAQVSAELACAGRSNRGDPDAHRRLVRNICAHHRTSLAEVSSFSTRLNQSDATQAQAWAIPISEAVKTCR